MIDGFRNGSYPHAARRHDGVKRPSWLRAGVIAVILLVGGVLAGCGASSNGSSASATSSSRSAALEAANKRERERAERERPAQESKAARAEAILKRVRPCEAVYSAEKAMTTSVIAAVKSGAGEATYEEASGDVEALRGKLGELASIATPEQRSQLEDSRRFLLKVGALVEAFKTHDLSLAQEELAGYRAGMVELGEHIKTACS